MGSAIQFLVEHNHKWEDIRGYTLSEFGVFLRESARREDYQHRARIIATWMGFNQDHKYIKDLSNRAHGSKPQQPKAEWNKLKLAMAKLRG